MYDVVADASKDLSLKWVPRAAIRLRDPTANEEEQEKQSRAWSTHLSRAREAEVRRVEHERAEALEKLRRARRGPGAPKGKEMAPLSEEEIERYREEVRRGEGY